VTIKTFRTKRDAADWTRSTEDEMVRGVYINRADAERWLLDKALVRVVSNFDGLIFTIGNGPSTRMTAALAPRFLKGV
jgi:hypothetical protein